MDHLEPVQNSEFLYNLLLQPKDSYSEDAKYFVDFLSSRQLKVNLHNLKLYVEYLNQIIEGRQLSASTYNKRLQGAKKRLRYIFTISPESFSVLNRYRFEEALKTFKPKKINSTAVPFENLLTNEEVQLLVSESEDKTASLVIEFLYATGLRISEALGVLLSNIVPSNGKDVVTVMGKGSKERRVFASHALIRKIRGYFNGTTFLFEHKGKRYNRISISNRISLQGKIILGKKISAHTLRHSFATTTLEKTGNLKGVSKYLGHSSVSTTANLYIHSELLWEDVSK
ncbi:MAG: tyrosine-type recombinase/integrase [Spirochaetia bacterium]|nr:tyrosine-type recombinase/integrase [Spirochaetia bacterium]MCF7945889.1 tyrosine-type recombinase/integrase [Spirochaetia bacterium]